VALFVGMALLRKPKGAPFNSATRTVFGVLCLLLTLGVGICYGVLFLTR
jgi:hypothetical protein